MQLESYTEYKKSKNEVILSAGEIGSPQLLILSGIGPAKLLFHVDMTNTSGLRFKDDNNSMIFHFDFRSFNQEPNKIIYIIQLYE